MSVVFFTSIGGDLIQSDNRVDGYSDAVDEC